MSRSAKIDGPGWIGVILCLLLSGCDQHASVPRDSVKLQRMMKEWLAEARGNGYICREHCDGMPDWDTSERRSSDLREVIESFFPLEYSDILTARVIRDRQLTIHEDAKSFYAEWKITVYLVVKSEDWTQMYLCERENGDTCVVIRHWTDEVVFVPESSDGIRTTLDRLFPCPQGTATIEQYSRYWQDVGELPCELQDSV